MSRKHNGRDARPLLVAKDIKTTANPEGRSVHSGRSSGPEESFTQYWLKIELENGAPKLEGIHLHETGSDGEKTRSLGDGG